jgi:RimJ/RimL family protein N-acetyltransferase
MDHRPRDLPTRTTTDRLILRPWITSDAGGLLDLHREGAEGLHRWYGGLLSQKEVSKGDVDGYIAAAIDGFNARTWIEYAAFERATGQLVGAVSLHHLDWTVPKGRVGYFVRPKAAGRGYATEMAGIVTRLAFSTLHLQRLEIRAATGNPASHTVPRKLGYRFLTVFEKNKVAADGTLWDLEIHVRFDAQHLPELDVEWA